ncbi:hypothetical protein WME90_29220 [Sorangium sp. So ce375]|uniref:hypothetical protein n=1 Tax=Sorangium sp. So ce375 TaxID=3133306 RepID=UPI003F5BCB4E
MKLLRVTRGPSHKRRARLAASDWLAPSDWLASSDWLAPSDWLASSDWLGCSSASAPRIERPRGAIREQSPEVGVFASLGAQLALGPGFLLVELLFGWGPLAHVATGACARSGSGSSPGSSGK